MKCLKIINAIHANINQYKNLGRKIRRIANIYLNQECSLSNIIPNYAKIKIPKISPLANFFFFAFESSLIFVIKNTIGMNHL